MSPSATRYDLDLDDKALFIALSHCPVMPPRGKETWVWLLEVTSSEFFTRPVYHVRDTSNTPSIIALYTPNPAEDAKRLKISPGKTIVLKDALPKQFADGRMGFRVEDLKTIEVIPLPLSRIRAIHTRLLATPLPTPIEPCVACRTHRAVSECTRCQARYYCSRDCQAAHWETTHRGECKATRKLWEWARMDWG